MIKRFEHGNAIEIHACNVNKWSSISTWDCHTYWYQELYIYIYI